MNLYVYLEPFKKSLISIVNYISENYKNGSYSTEIFLSNYKDKFIIDFVLMPVYDKEYKNKSNTYSEESKIFSLINGGIITKTYRKESHIISIAFVNTGKNKNN